MTLQKEYEKETGDICPNMLQEGFNEWLIRFSEWLESKVIEAREELRQERDFKENYLKSYIKAHDLCKKERKKREESEKLIDSLDRTVQSQAIELAELENKLKALTEITESPNRKLKK